MEWIGDWELAFYRLSFIDFGFGGDGMAVERGLSFVEGEQKVVVFRVRDDVGGELDLTGSEVELRVVLKVDGLEYIRKKDEVFDKTGADRGIVKCTFLAGDLGVSGNYEGQFRVKFLDLTVDKSNRFDILVEPAIVG